MLCELFIENLAVIEKTSVKLEKGLNVFTGETGAGKSIVIDAINAVLGQRSNREIVRHGAANASVTARFADLPQRVTEHFAESGYPDENGELIINREISADGGSSARVNGKPITVTLLKELGTELINIHGQHDNQVLLSPEKHIDILDKYGDIGDAIEEYRACFKRVATLKRDINRISMDEQEKADKIDLLTYQVKEISDAELRIGEDEELQKQHDAMKNSEKITLVLTEAYRALYGTEGEGGAVDMAGLACSAAEKATELYQEAGAVYSSLDDCLAALQDSAAKIEGLIENVRFNSEEMEQIEERTDELIKLKRKYGGSIQSALEYLENAKKELNELELSDKLLNELAAEAEKEYARLIEIAEKLTQKRREAAERFVQSVTEELTFLDMPGVKLEVQFTQTKPSSKGRDAIEFLISANKGEPPKPIAKIASGGELSRIMLAIKNTLADRDDIPTLIFDEVDTGVSGRAAQKIGLKLKQAARNRQILTVTHLAQIAALGDNHYLIKKDSDESRAYTKVEKLDREGRIKEIARIIGTDSITELTLENAAEMIDLGAGYNA